MAHNFHPVAIDTEVEDFARNRCTMHT